MYVSVYKFLVCIMYLWQNGDFRNEAELYKQNTFLINTKNTQQPKLSKREKTTHDMLIQGAYMKYDNIHVKSNMPSSTREDD